jgi:hypothetical protein
MAEKPPPDYVAQRAEIQKELFLDTRLAETGLPFDGESLLQDIGETGLSGYYLQHGARRARPPHRLQPILDQADEIVAKTLDRHNRDARFTEPPYGRSVYYILTQPTLEAVAAVTTTVLKRWTRTLWTKDHTLLLPDRRMYKHRDSQLTEKEASTEAHAKAIIIETGAAVMEVASMAVHSLTSERNQRGMSEIVAGRGPEFLRRWLSKDIMFTWLEATGRPDEKPEWDEFVNKAILLRALNHDIVNPLVALEKIKHAQDSLSTSAISSRSGWSARRVNQTFPMGTRKQIAAKSSDINESIDRAIARFEALSTDKICAYTGWGVDRVNLIFTDVQRRKIATERRDPIEDAVRAIAKAYDFIEDTERLASFLGKPVDEVTARFTPVLRREIARRMRPEQSNDAAEQAESPETADAADANELKDIKAAVQEVSRRLDLLYSPEDLAPLFDWTPEQTSERILHATINHFATKGGDFSATLQDFCSKLARFDDAYLARLLGISEQTAQEKISWSVRQRCLLDFAGNPNKAFIEWWRGDKKIGSSKRLVEA